MDELMEQLREANPEPRPDPIPIGFVWDKLERRDSRRRRRPRLRSVPVGQVASWLPGVFTVGLSALVAGVVVVAVRSHPKLGTGSRGSTAGCLVTAPLREASQVGAVLSRVQLLRRPVTSEDISAAACTARAQILLNPAPVPTDPGYKLAPVEMRYVGPGVLGGKVFMYLLPGAPRAVAYRGVPAHSGLAKSETEPSVCLITVGGTPAANPGGCTNLSALETGSGANQAAQIPGTATSVLSGVVRDGITAVRVYDRGKLVNTVRVQHNVVQFIIDHNASAAADDLRLRPVF
jgi:hypothetical protein